MCVQDSLICILKWVFVSMDKCLVVFLTTARIVNTTKEYMQCLQEQFLPMDFMQMYLAEHLTAFLTYEAVTSRDIKANFSTWVAHVYHKNHYEGAHNRN